VSRPAGYFDRTPTITNEDQMMDLLKVRAGAQARLQWLPPVKATQRTTCGQYELRAARSQKTLIYWAWVLADVPRPKLIGHSPDPAIARNFCEADLRWRKPCP
jgi:hypothetical protein